MAGTQKLFNKVFFYFFELLLAVLSFLVFVLLILPTLSVVATPLFIWRWLLIGWVKLFRKDIMKIMGGKNPVLAVDDMHKRPLCTIVGMGAFHHGLTIEIATDYLEAIINTKDGKSGEYVHPKLRSYYFEWMGFFWWKLVNNFSLEDHLKVYNFEGDTDKVITEEEFIQIVAELESRPFPEGKSPWEVLLVKNCLIRNVADPEMPKFLYVFRFHHGLADGISVMQVFMKYVFDGSMEKVAKPRASSRNNCQEVMFRIKAGFNLPYQFFKQGLSALDVNDWHLPEDKLSRKIYKAWSERMSIERIREIKKIHGVGFTAVIVGVIAGAIRKMMIAHNVKVPEKMHAILPLPWPNHPHKFCNHWSYGFIALPVGKAEGKTRLRKAHGYVNELKRSPSPYVNFAVLKFFNLLPTWIIEKTTVTNYFPSVILSNFPGPPALSEGIGGFPLVDCMFTGGPLRGNIGISVTILSYNGALRFVAGVDSSVFPKQEMANKFIELIENEFSVLLAEEAV